MAKLSRILQRVFGSSAGPDQIAQFGSLFAGAPAFTTDPAVAQSLSNWLTGWAGAAIGGNSPAIEDMNAAMFVMTYQLAYLCQAGVAEWDSSTTYYIGSLVNDGNGVLYKSLTDNNLGNLVTDTTNWRKLGSFVPVNPKSISYTVTGNDSFIPCNAGAGAITQTLPSAASVPGQILYFKKVDSSANAVTLLAGGADTIDGASSMSLTIQFESTVLISDGSTSWSTF